MHKFLPIILAASALASPLAAQSLKPDEVLSSMIVRPLAEPNPVVGTDNRTHLAYELAITNVGTEHLAITSVAALDPEGHALRTIDGDHLKAMTKQFAGDPGLLPPGSLGVVLMDVSLPAGAAVPNTLRTRIAATRLVSGPDGKLSPLPAGLMVPASYEFVTPPVAVGRPARVIDAPLRGANWVATNGCCDLLTPHRGAMMAVNGVLVAPERFAIDWEQIDSRNRTFAGNKRDLSSWPYYGTTVHAVADGVVVNIYDGAAEQVPGVQPTGITTDNIGGNMMVVDIGEGAYAFYAHMQRGSLRAKLGDRVSTGQVLGLLGNTGNSTAPHLHFHLMDAPSPLNANGLPYVIRSFTTRGVIPASQEANIEEATGPVTIEPRNVGRHENRMPLDDDVVDFGAQPGG